MTARAGRAGELRRGWTTGACATAATRAAYTALVTGRFPDPVSVTLPGGEEPSFPLVLAERGAGHGRAAVRKDAGDDPDVTHGALVESWVRPAPAGAGIVFRAGEGGGHRDQAGPQPRRGRARDQPGAPHDDRSDAGCARARARRAGRRLRRHRHPGRPPAGGAHDERPPRHRGRPLGAGHVRHREALLLRRVDRLDPPGDRRGGRDRRHPPRGGDGPRLGGGGAGALRPRRERAHRHGRFRWAPR